MLFRSGRGDVQCGHRDGARDSGGLGALDRWAYGVRHRPPALHAAQGVPPVRDRGRSPGGERHAYRAAREGTWEVSQVVRDAIATAIARLTPGRWPGVNPNGAPVGQPRGAAPGSADPFEGGVMELTTLGRPVAAVASELTLERRADGRLWAVRGGAERAVWVRRCFPWSEPARLVSLRDDEEREFALVRDPAELDPASRRVLEEAMVAAGFVFEITQVTAIEEEVEIRHWRVETRQGTGPFPNLLHDRPPALPPRGLLIRDVAGDLYHVTNPAALDDTSRALLWAFVD